MMRYFMHHAHPTICICFLKLSAARCHINICQMISDLLDFRYYNIQFKNTFSLYLIGTL